MAKYEDVERFDPTEGVYVYGLGGCVYYSDYKALLKSHGELVRALEAVKLRIHFIGWPTEPMYEGHTDWRKEIGMLETALANAKGE